MFFSIDPDLKKIIRPVSSAVDVSYPFDDFTCEVDLLVQGSVDLSVWVRLAFGRAHKNRILFVLNDSLSSLKRVFRKFIRSYL